MTVTVAISWLGGTSRVKFNAIYLAKGFALPFDVGIVSFSGGREDSQKFCIKRSASNQNDCLSLG